MRATVFLLLFVIGNADVSLFAMLNSIASEYGFVSADSTLFVCFSFVQFASSKLPGIKDNTGFECSNYCSRYKLQRIVKSGKL